MRTTYYKTGVSVVCVWRDKVILNILSNAVKYTDEGYIQVNIEFLKLPKKNYSLDISIKDTGIGIPKEKIQDIFLPFTKLHPSYQGIYKGVGLGLYSAKKYIDIMNGNIKVHSNEGKGSIFNIVIPISLGDM